VGIKTLQHDAKGSAFVSSGDNTIAVYAGRVGPVTGTAVIEDLTTANAILAVGLIASAAFTVDTGAATGTVTYTNFVPTGQAVSIGDGTDGGNTAEFSISFTAASVVMAAGI